MINENKWTQYGYKRDIKDIYGITIHNTNNYYMSAKEIFAMLNADTGNNGCHYLVDYLDVVEVMPLDWAVYHTGKGDDFGNHYTIAVEICSNLNDDLYFDGEAKAVELIKELMKEYDITKDKLYFHKDFNSKAYCPATIIEKYGNKNNFIDRNF